MAHDFILMDVLREDWFATREVRLAARFKDQDSAENETSSGQTAAD